MIGETIPVLGVLTGLVVPIAFLSGFTTRRRESAKR